MKPEFIELIGNARKRRSKRYRNQLYIFLMCLLVSILLWALVKLSREYYYTIDYRLNFTHIPVSYRLVKASDTILTLNLKVQGYDFFTDRVFRSSSHQYDLDLSTVQPAPHGPAFQGYLLTAPIGYEITSRSRFQNYLISVTPDTIYLYFERKR